jgi:uncharacterized membrane protein
MADDAPGIQPPQPPPPPPAPPPMRRAPPGDQSAGMQLLAAYLGNPSRLVLAYCGLLALIPLILEKKDRELQWHARHGLVLFGAFVILNVVIGIVSAVLGGFAVLYPFAWLLWIAVSMIAIVKAVNGQRLLIPGLSEYANKF